MVWVATEWRIEAPTARRNPNSARRSGMPSVPGPSRLLAVRRVCYAGRNEREEAMGGFSSWHWLIVGLVVALAIGAVISAVVLLIRR